MSEYIYKLNGLNKVYGTRTVLDIKELYINSEEITAVIGPSGSGKSTLLEILNCIELPTKGSINFDGTNFPEKGNLNIEIRRQMAMVFQKPVVFNSTVYDNIAYSLKLRKVQSNIIKERIDDISEITGLKDKLKQNAKTLSGGEAQRVAVARAIVIKPRVLLLDEPTANLDPANITVIEKLIKHANLNYKTSIIIVTHNMSQAKRLGNRLIFLLNGIVVEYGDAKKIFAQPESAQTVDFINGEMIY